MHPGSAWPKRPSKRSACCPASGWCLSPPTPPNSLPGTITRSRPLNSNAGSSPVPENSPFRNNAQDTAASAGRVLETLPPRSVVRALRSSRPAAPWRAPLALLLCGLLLPGQVYKVDPQKTITFQVEGATAAYTLDEFFADATAENGVVTVQGK